MLESSTEVGVSPSGTTYRLGTGEDDGPLLCLIAEMASGVGGMSCARPELFERSGLALGVTEGPAALAEDREPFGELAVLLPEGAVVTSVPDDATRVGDLIIVKRDAEDFDGPSMLRSIEFD